MLSTDIATHTPGPWVVANGLQVWADGPSTVRSPRICTVQNASTPVQQLSEAEMAANARLIAAAPDLLAALVEAEKVIRWAAQEAAGRVDKEKVCGWIHHADKTRAAIVAATRPS